MKRGFAVLSVIVLMTLVFLPFRGKGLPTLLGKAPEVRRVVVAEAAVKPEIVKPKKLVSLENYLTRLAENGAPNDSQAVLLKTLDGKVLVENNADTPLNPASVMKLSVSYLTLKHFGPDHKFKTIAYTTGLIDSSKQVLYGDLVIETEGDPNFTVADASALADSVRSQGIKRVEGTLIIKGPLLLRHTANPEYIYGKLKSALKLKFSKNVEAVQATDHSSSEKVLLAVHYSQPLRDLLLYMNAHSDNYYAEHFGQILGGPDSVEAELKAEFNLKPEQLVITHTSGLDYNRITPRVSLTIFQKMINFLKSSQMRVEDIMPVVGVDSGTLINRLTDTPLLGSVVAKTGTLHVTDDGASILQGVVYTEQYGPVMFAIFNMVGKVHYFRQEQDLFLTELVSELALTPKTVRLTNIFPDEAPTLSEVADFPASKAYGRHSRRR